MGLKKNPHPTDKKCQDGAPIVGKKKLCSKRVSNDIGKKIQHFQEPGEGSPLRQKRETALSKTEA